MSKGQVKEFFPPYLLLQDNKSELFQMVEKTGHQAARKLHQIAKDAYFKLDQGIA